MSCPKCSSFDCKKYESSNHIIYACNKCGKIYGDFENKDYCCGHKRVEIVKFEMQNKQFRKSKMCINCLHNFGNVKITEYHKLYVTYDERQRIKGIIKDEFYQLFRNAQEGKEHFKNYYYKYLQSDEWKKKRLERLKLDKFQCQVCGNRSGTLDVHHTTYQTLHNENINDLITVCRNCHTKLHQND